jgi:hypothetical protein
VARDHFASASLPRPCAGRVPALMATANAEDDSFDDDEENYEEEHESSDDDEPRTRPQHRGAQGAQRQRGAPGMGRGGTAPRRERQRGGPRSRKASAAEKAAIDVRLGLGTYVSVQKSASSGIERVPGYSGYTKSVSQIKTPRVELGYCSFERYEKQNIPCPCRKRRALNAPENPKIENGEGVLFPLPVDIRPLTGCPHPCIA